MLYACSFYRVGLRFLHVVHCNINVFDFLHTHTHRVESYSCKMAGNDKRLYKQLSHQDSGGSNTSAGASSATNTPTPTTGLQALSPPLTFVGSPVFPCPGTSPASLGSMVPSVLVRTMSGSSAQGLSGDAPQLCDSCDTRTLFYLQSTLTASFQPDYDFTDAKSDEFSRVPSIRWVVDAVRSNLSAAAGEAFMAIEDQLWSAIDEEIRLGECDISRSVC